ncbi:MAG TPA: hypothetical protein VMQ54_11270 [Steroidobacteraceae bacterium]|nr:hypothetical protein [Steroidobacteraceae bacterium]
MARYVRKNHLYPLALSILGAATTLGVRPELIRAAVRNGELKMYRPPMGVKRQKLLTDDLVKWVREKWVQCQ